MGDALTTLRLAVALEEVSTRARIAAELARHLAVDSVLVFAPDPEIGSLLPAPGWPQTVHRYAAIRAVLAECRAPGAHRCALPTGNGERTTPLVALVARDGTVMVLLGGSPADGDVEQLMMVLPLLSAALRSEVEARAAKGDAAAAREASRHAQDLATAFEATRGQLEALLRESAALRDEAERARQRVALLDRVTRELVVGFRDVDEALARVADAMVPAIANWCAVYVPTVEGNVRLAALSVPEDTARMRVRRALEAFPIDPSAPHGVAAVLRTGTTEYVPDTSRHVAAALAIDDGSPDVTERCCLAVPLKGHGRVLGVLRLAMPSASAFADDDRALVEEIANRAAVVIEQRRLLEDARAARSEAERASRAKDEFLAMLGHEIRNPLAPILTALALMKMRGDGGARERVVIERQIRHVTQLVDDLLDVSRITRGTVALRRETLLVSEIVATAAEMALPLVEERRHRLTVDVEEHLFVDGDARRLAQVISNLLTNAAKYTPNGGSISLRAKRDGDDGVVTIRDNGIGMEADLLPRVFEIFTQAPQTLERGPGGLGLGLAIVRRLVELHGGTVEARSAGRGRGSEFVVRLPAVAAPRQSMSAAPVASPVSEPPRRRILVVDDNEDSALLLKDLLSLSGHQAEMALDGPSALQLLERFVPDTALLDIGLPVMSGFELARHIRARFPSIVLVAITGYGQPADREATSAAGFDAHLVKPIDIDDVNAALARAEPKPHAAR